LRFGHDGRADTTAIAGKNDVVVTEGNVVDAIIETAAQYDCDKIVMEPTRRSVLGRAVLGSVVRGGVNVHRPNGGHHTFRW